MPNTSGYIGSTSQYPLYVHMIKLTFDWINQMIFINFLGYNCTAFYIAINYTAVKANTLQNQITNTCNLMHKDRNFQYYCLHFLTKHIIQLVIQLIYYFEMLMEQFKQK